MKTSTNTSASKYTYELRAGLEKALHKLVKKNPEQVRRIGKKIQEIIHCKDITHYKNLHTPQQHLKRVHIDNSFVLVFSVQKKHVIFEEFDHHDNIYK